MAKFSDPYSLDVDSPEKVAEVLEFAANQYRESSEELASSWQDWGAGAPWTEVAKVLENAAKKLQKKEREGWE